MIDYQDIMNEENLIETPVLEEQVDYQEEDRYLDEILAEYLQEYENEYCYLS